MDLFENLKNDKRLLDYFLKIGQITQKEYDEKMNGAEDASHLADTLSFESLSDNTSSDESQSNESEQESNSEQENIEE